MRLQCACRRSQVVPNQKSRRPAGGPGLRLFELRGEPNEGSLIAEARCEMHTHR